MQSSIELLESRIAPASIALGTGTMPAGNTTLEMADTLSATLNDGAGSGKLVVTGTVEINGAALALDVSQLPADQQDFILIENDDTDAIDGTFAGLPEGAVFKADGTYFQISYTAGDGNDVELTALVPKVAISGGGKVAKYTDVDGDLVTVKTTKGTFEEGDFTFVPEGGMLGAQLTSLKLDAGFAGATVSFTAKRDLLSGNGFVNVGFIDASGVNLGAVSLKGDLGAIEVGDGLGTSALKSLTVQSMGRLGTSTQEAGGAIELNALGRVGTVTVKSDVVGGDFSAAGFTTIKVTGSFVGGSITAAMDIGTLTITRDIRGTEAAPVEISAFGKAVAPKSGADNAIKTLSVGGNVEWANVRLGLSATGDNSDASIATVKVGGDWIASNLTVGTRAGLDGFLGTSDDELAKTPGATARDNVKLSAQIGSLSIGGQVFGTAGNTNDQFGISAEWIKKAVIGGEKYPLFAGIRSNDDFFPIASTGAGAGNRLSDVVLLEVLG